MPRHVIRLSGLTLLTLVAFAGNSLLTRAALVDPANDALSFTAVRLISGALCLLVVAILTSRSVRVAVRDVPAVLALFVYAVGFSLAYNQMGAATGALVLFALVQATMLVVGLWRGMRLPVAGMVGVALAMAGLVWLLLPGLSAPPVGAAALMAVAGIAWGVYSLLGQGSRDPDRAHGPKFHRNGAFGVGAPLDRNARTLAIGLGLGACFGGSHFGLGLRFVVSCPAGVASACRGKRTARRTGYRGVRGRVVPWRGDHGAACAGLDPDSCGDRSHDPQIGLS